MILTPLCSSTCSSRMVTDKPTGSYLIIGGLGYVGSHLANHIFKTQPRASVVVLDRISKNSNLSRISQDLRNSKFFALVVGDVANEKLLTKTMADYKVETIFYTAISVDDCSCEWNPTSVARNDLLGLTHTLEAARAYDRLKKFVYVSSEEVYGNSYDEKKETLILKPRCSIAASQSGAEAMLNAYVISYRLPLIIARLSRIILGGTMNADNILLRIMQGEEKTVLEGRCGVLHIDDAVAGINACAEKGAPGEIFNIGGTCDVTQPIILQILKAVKDGCDVSKIELLNASMNSARALKQLSWQPKLESTQRLIESSCKTLKCATKAETSSAPLKFLVYGANGWIGKQFIKLLAEKKINYCVGKKRIGTDNDDAVLDEIVGCAPSHIVSMVGRAHSSGQVSDILEGGPGKLCDNVRDNLYSSWLLASFCDRLGIHFTNLGSGHIFKFDRDHPIGGRPFKEDDEPNCFESSLSIVKGHTDRALRFFQNTLNARIRLPINYELDSHNLINKVVASSKVTDNPESVTILPICLPILLDLAINRTCGTINLVNPGSVRLPEIAGQYRKVVDPTFHYEILRPEDYKGIPNQQPSCVLDTAKLEKLYPNIPTALEGIQHAISEIALRKGKHVLHHA